MQRDLRKGETHFTIRPRTELVSEAGAGVSRAGGDGVHRRLALSPVQEGGGGGGLGREGGMKGGVRGGGHEGWGVGGGGRWEGGGGGGGGC